MSKLKERRREIQAMDLVTAEQELKTLRRQLFDLRIQKERGEVKDTSQFSKTKDDIARLLYHIGELRHEAAMEAAGLVSAEPTGAREPTEPTEPTTPRAARASRATATRSAQTTAEAGAGTSGASVPLAQGAPTDALSTPELPAPTGGSEE